MGIGVGAMDAIGELAIKVVPDTTGFGDAVGKGVGAQVQTASRVGLGVVTAVGGGLIALGTQLDSAYDNIRTQTGATGDELLALQDTFSQVAASTPASLDDVGVAVAGVVQKMDGLGVNTDAVAGQLLDLSRITDTDLNTNLDAAAELMQRFGVSGGEVEGVMDNVFRASQASGVGFSEIADTLTKAKGALDTLNIPMADATNLVGLLGKNGVNADGVMRGLNKVIAQAAKDGVPAEEALSHLVDSIKAAPDATTAAGLAIEAFGARAGVGLADAIREGTFSLGDLDGALGTSKDTIGGVADETADAAETFAQLKNQLAISLGPAANRLFATFGKSAADMAPSLVLVVDALAPILETIAALPAPLLAGGIGLLAVGSAAGKIAAPLKALNSVFKLFAANPWVIIIAATIALTIIIIKNWSEIKAFLVKTWDAIAGAFDATVDAIVSAARSFADAMVAAFNAVVDGITSAWDAVVDATTTAWDAVTGAVTTAWDTVVGVVTTAIDTVTGVVTTAWETIRNITATAWEAVRLAVQTVLDAIMLGITTYFGFYRTIIETAWNAIRTVTSNVWEGIRVIIDVAVAGIKSVIDGVKVTIDGLRTAFDLLKSTATTVWNGLKTTIGGAIDFLIRKIDQLKRAAENALGPLGNVLGKAGGFVGKIPGFDLGGIVPGPIGSAQLIMAHGGETVLPTHRQPIDAALASQGLTGTSRGDLNLTVVYPDEVVIREERDIVELGRSTAREVDREVRAQGG